MTAAARNAAAGDAFDRSGSSGSPRGAWIARLTLTEFRSYRQVRLEAGASPIVLTGPNGAGKTNLLEAVSLLSPGRGLRAARPAELQRIGSLPDAPWGVAATIDGPGGAALVGTGREFGTERRVVQIDGKPAKSQAALAELLTILWLTPQMDRLFAEGAKSRRRFLDRLVFGFDAAHAGRATRYESALRQRARLLAERPRETAWLDAVEAEMAATGVALAAARRDMVARLERALAAASGPFPRPILAAEGAVEARLAAEPALAAEDWLRAALAANRPADQARGETAIGAHRSDFAVTDADKGVPASLASTGEQKALLVAIVLAAARLIAAERRRAPILLLDEVAAHLDGDRRAALFEEIVALAVQAWLTGTDPGLFAPLGDHAQRFAVRDGRIAVG
jgi:DNA replication and repair protein RecF